MFWPAERPTTSLVFQRWLTYFYRASMSGLLCLIETLTKSIARRNVQTLGPSSIPDAAWMHADVPKARSPIWGPWSAASKWCLRCSSTTPRPRHRPKTAAKATLATQAFPPHPHSFLWEFQLATLYHHYPIPIVKSSQEIKFSAVCRYCL
jgi:hypothetical protein